MKKICLFLVVIGLLVVYANSAFAGNPNEVQSLLPAPTISIDVTLTNSPGTCPVMSCKTWYVSVWEWDGSSGYAQIGSAQSLGPNQTYWSWSSLSYDTSYHYIALRWHFSGTCSCCTTNDVFTDKLYTGSPVQFVDFYPCQ